MSSRERHHRVHRFSTRELDGLVRGAMYLLQAKLDAEADPWSFYRRLSRCDEVLLLRDGEGWLRGFATLRTCSAQVDGRPLSGVLTADLALDPAGGGGRTLRRALLRRLLRGGAARPWWLAPAGSPAARLMAEAGGDTPPPNPTHQAFAGQLVGEISAEQLLLARPAAVRLLWASLTAR